MFSAKVLNLVLGELPVPPRITPQNDKLFGEKFTHENNLFVEKVVLENNVTCIVQEKASLYFHKFSNISIIFDIIRTLAGICNFIENELQIANPCF